MVAYKLIYFSENKINQSGIVNWRVAIDFFKPEWKKITVLLMFLTVYLTLSYSTLWTEFSGLVALHGRCIYNVVKYAKIFRHTIGMGNMTNRTCFEIGMGIDETFTEYMEAKRMIDTRIENFRNSLKPIFFVLSPGIGELGSFIFYENFKLIVLFLYWYLLSCVIFWIHKKLRRPSTTT